MASDTVSTASSSSPAVLKTAARAAVEGGVIAVVGGLLAARIWPDEKTGIVVGTAAAWAATSVSLAWLFWARGREMKVFWWAFGGGMALRGAVLGALFAWGLGRKDVSLESLLVSYVFAVLTLLLTLEMRHLRLK